MGIHVAIFRNARYQYGLAEILVMDAITRAARFREILLPSALGASRLHLCKLTLKVIGAREADDPPEIRFRAKFL